MRKPEKVALSHFFDTPVHNTMCCARGVFEEFFYNRYGKCMHHAPEQRSPSLSPRLQPFKSHSMIFP